MSTVRDSLLFGLVFVGVGLLCVQAAEAVMLIKPNAVTSTSGNETQSGNGRLDLILFGFSGGGGVNSNELTGLFNGDDANTQMPGGGKTSISGSYITSMGELRAFYRLNFPDGLGGSRLNEIVLFVDMNETGQANDIKLDSLAIAVNGNPFPGNDNRNVPHNVDLPSTAQNNTGGAVNGGTILAQLDPGAGTFTLPLNIQGAGWADLYIPTGINPFSSDYQDSTRVQFVWNSRDHDDGGDKVFLSGAYAPVVPEPATLALLILSGLAGLGRRSLKA